MNRAYALSFTVSETSRFQAYIEADSPEAALADARERAKELGGWEHLGTWVHTDDVQVDPDSVVVEEVISPE